MMLWLCTGPYKIFSICPESPLKTIYYILAFKRDDTAWAPAQRCQSIYHLKLRKLIHLYWQINIETQKLTKKSNWNVVSC